MPGCPHCGYYHPPDGMCLSHGDKQMNLKTTKMRFILLNGPPKSGKTFLSKLISERLSLVGYHPAKESFAAPMKNYLASALGERYEDLAKDMPHPVLRGYTPREFLIAESEQHMKVRYGTDIYGRLLYHRVMRLLPNPDYVVIDDCGFAEEAEPLGEHEAILVKVIREGTSFENDSRSYWFDGDEHYSIQNNGGKPEAERTINWLVRDIVERFN